MNQCSCGSVGGNTRQPDLLSGLSAAMAYVPWQTDKQTFEPGKALSLGTIYPELYKPFCGKRGGCR